MQVLLLNDASTGAGGAELQTLRLRELLAQRGHQVRVLSSTAAGPGEQPQADVLCHGTLHPKARVLNETVNLSAVRALRRELADHPPDVVHARMFLTQLSPAILPLLRRVPVLWHVVEYKAICPKGTKLLNDGTLCPHPSGRACLSQGCLTPQSWLVQMLQQRLRRRWAGSVDTVVTLGRTMRRRLEAEGVAVDEVIGNGVRSRPARPPLTGPPVVAFAGRLVPEKGVDVLVRAMVEVRSRVPGARLTVVGTGGEERALRRLAADLLPAGSVRFTGLLDRAAVELELDGAWVQAVPGLWEEPLGNVSLEAAVRGTAVVATDLGGPGEVVRHDETGLLVPPGSVTDLAEALVALLGDRGRCERLGARAREIAMVEWTEDRMVDKVLDVYARMTTDDGAATGRADGGRA